MTSTNKTMNHPIAFCCRLTCDPESTLEQSAERFAMQPEEGKKSSFFYSSADSTLLGVPCVDGPAHLIVEVLLGKIPFPFIAGGFELVSNARNIEVYISNEGRKESYLTTCRGVKFQDSHKALLVIPGGPKSMTRLRLKFLSLQPDGAKEFQLYLFKLKGRLPEIATDTSNSEPKNEQISSPIRALPLQSSPQPILRHDPQQQLSMSDIIAAVAGVSLMVRSSEDRLAHAINEAVGDLTSSLATRMLQMGRLLTTQSQQIDNLQVLVQQQQILLQTQTVALEQLRLDHANLLQTMISKTQQSDTEQIDSVTQSPRKADLGDRLQQDQPGNEVQNGLRENVLSQSGQDEPPSRSRSIESQEESREIIDAVETVIDESVVISGDDQDGEIDEVVDDDDDRPHSRPRHGEEQEKKPERENELEPPDKGSAIDSEDGDEKKGDK